MQLIRILGVVLKLFLDLALAMLGAFFQRSADALTPRPQATPGRVDEEIFRQPSHHYYTGPGNHRGK